MIWTTLSLLPLLLLGPASASGADEELTNSLGMRMRPVPAGEFVMGRAVGGDYDERPVHRVTISRPFLMSAELVTNAQFEQYDPAHRRRDGGRDEDPVVDVTWHGATAFTLWLAAREGRLYRLPTEAEWEYAARAGGDRVEPWTGADPDTGRLFHFQGVGSHPNQGHQVLAMRTSDDSGASWTPPRVINHDRSMWNPHVVMRSREGHLIVTSDYNFDQPMWGRIIVSRDGGESWREPPGKIHGQHCGIVQLDDGRLMAVGRDNWNAEHVATPGLGLPISTSDDGGGNTGRFISDATFAEPRGYLQATQTPDGVIHLVSSRLHYQFNLAWLKTPTPAAE